jgi:hypothetical protein
MYRPMTEQACYLSKPTEPLDDGAQLDLMGGESPLSPGPREQPPLFDRRPFDRPPSSPAGSRTYHSPAWAGPVTEPTLEPDRSDWIDDETYALLYGSDGSRMPTEEDWQRAQPGIEAAKERGRQSRRS